MDTELTRQAKQMRDEMVAQATRRADEWYKMTLAALGQAPPYDAESITRRHGPPDPLGDLADLPQEQRLSPQDTLIGNIRKVVRSFGYRTFSTLDVAKAIQEVYATDTPSRRSVLSATLKKLAVNYRELAIIRPGRGSSPTKYRAVPKGGES